jgi:chorismate synthase
MKPIATTIASQESVDLSGGGKTETHYERSDFCAVPRAAVVGEGMVCLVLADAVMEKCGGDSLDEVRNRFDRLPRGTLSDFHLSPGPKNFW